MGNLLFQAHIAQSPDGRPFGLFVAPQIPFLFGLIQAASVRHKGDRGAGIIEEQLPSQLVLCPTIPRLIELYEWLRSRRHVLPPEALPANLLPA